MKARRLIAEAAVITVGTLFWLALTAVIGLPVGHRPEHAEAAATRIPSVELPQDVLERRW